MDAIGLKAETALRESRLDDAARHINKLSQDSLPERFWKLLFEGALQTARSQLFEAEERTWQALGVATALGVFRATPAGVCGERLTARAFHQLGWITRRQDRPHDALALHGAAYRLRVDHGSNEERWETCVELGLAAGLAGKGPEAEEWLRKAIEWGERAIEESAAKQAVAWGHLSRLNGQREQHDQAVEAARTARRLWHRHDPTTATAAQADLRLGSALLNLAAFQRQKGEPVDSRLWEEASTLLEAAAESLAAFGAAHSADARWAREQLDFAKRLRSDMA